MVQEALVADPGRPSVPEQRGTHARRLTKPDSSRATNYLDEYRRRADDAEVVWLFSLVLGFSRLIWARFVVHQDLPAVLRCHASAFEALGGVPREVLYDRMKTAVIGEGERRASTIWPPMAM